MYFTILSDETFVEVFCSADISLAAFSTVSEELNCVALIFLVIVSDFICSSSSFWILYHLQHPIIIKVRPVTISTIEATGIIVVVKSSKFALFCILLIEIWDRLS